MRFLNKKFDRIRKNLDRKFRRYGKVSHKTILKRLLRDEMRQSYKVFTILGVKRYIMKTLKYDKDDFAPIAKRIKLNYGKKR